MTAEEVSVVHVAEEEVVASSSSKAEIVVDKEKEKEKEDLSNGANGKVVVVDTGGDDDGSYVFVNGNDGVNGDPVESDLEKNDNGIGGEDRGVEIENFECKGEVKSESDLVKDLEREGGSCIGIVDQDKESIESCHVEGPVDEQKSGDLVESAPVSAINAEGGVSETFRADQIQNGVSKSPDDVSDSNGDALPNGIAKHTVETVAVLDSSAKQSDDVSSASVSDSNGGSLANGSVGVNAVDSGSKENEDSEIAVADYDCNGDDLVNDSVQDNVVDSESKEKEESEMAVADDRDGNGDGLADGTVEDNVVDPSKENEDSEMVVADDGDCNGDILANDGAKDTDSKGVVDTGNEQNGVFELPVSDDGVPTVSASDSNGNGLPNGRIEDTVPEAVVVDSRTEQNDGVPVFVSDSNGDGLPADAVDDSVSEVSKPEQNESSNRVEAEADSHDPVSNGDGDKPEQNGFAVMSETVHPDVISSIELVKGGENLVAMNEVPVEGGLDLEGTSERDLSSVADTLLEKETGRGSISDECGESLQDVGIPEKVVINDSVDSSQSSQQSGVSDSTAEALPVDDEKVETEVIKSDENSRGRSDSHNIEISEVDIDVVGDSVDDSKSSCLANVLESETKISSDSIVSEEAEVSKGLAECDSMKDVSVDDSDEKLTVADLQKDSSLAASLSNDEKAAAAVESLSAVSNPDISGNDGIVHESGVSNCDNNDNEKNSAVINGGIQFGSVGECQEPEGLEEVERKKPFYFLIRVPRFDDENLKEQIRLAQIRVDEKTQSRDAIRIEMQSQRATCKEYGNNFDAALTQERAARDLHRSKRQEIESIQSVMNIEDMDAEIRNMEHMIQHETLPLKEEKQLIREIKQLKQTRDRLSCNMGRQDEVQQGSDQKNPIEERLKSLKKEADQLKVNLLKAEAVTKVAKKKYQEETEKLNKLQSQFKAADDIRQEAYVQLQSLKKQSYEKNKYSWRYRDDAKTANDLALKGDKEALQDLCINQVEKFMDVWNNNDEFRKEYLRCNVRSTLRRLRTLDGRALGPDEELPVIPQVVNDRSAKDHTVSSSAIEERTQEKVALVKAEKANDKPVAMAVEQKNQTSKSEKSLKSVPPATDSTTASSKDKIEEAVEEKPKRTKEEEEAARKAEELRKEEEAAKLREQRRLEEIAKAKEALERKRRIAEKAQARAAVRAQKEAEEKEKEREKRAKKKERRKVAAATVGDATATDEMVSAAPTSETPAETAKESETKETPVTVTKRSQQPSQFKKQNKAKSIPPPLRNRGKRRMQPWMWVILIILGIFALFLIGNYNFSFNLGLQRFNF